MSFLLAALVIAPVAAEVTFSTSSPHTIAKGDTVVINGTNAGNDETAIWIIGRDYFDVKTVRPENNGNFSVIIPPAETSEFSSGRYAIVIQSPGPNGKREISARTGTGNISFWADGHLLADIGSRKDIHTDAEPVVDKLVSFTRLSGVDDEFSPSFFYVEEPSIHFDQLQNTGPESGLPNQTAGTGIHFTGTTNMGVENVLQADIHNLDTNVLVMSEMVPVLAGEDLNHWSLEVPEPGLPSGDYYVTVGWQKSNITGTGSAMFTVEKPASGNLPIPAILGGGILITTGILAIGTSRKR